MSNVQLHKKVVSVSFLALAALVAFIVLSALLKLSSVYDLESKFRSIEYVFRIASVLIGAEVFVVLYKTPTVVVFSDEVVSELLEKVTWPSSKETTVATGLVLIIVGIASLFLALSDWVSTSVLQWFWHLSQGIF